MDLTHTQVLLVDILETSISIKSLGVWRPRVYPNDTLIGWARGSCIYRDSRKGSWEETVFYFLVLIDI